MPALFFLLNKLAPQSQNAQTKILGSCSVFVRCHFSTSLVLRYGRNDTELHPACTNTKHEPKYFYMPKNGHAKWHDRLLTVQLSD